MRRHRLLSAVTGALLLAAFGPSTRDATTGTVAVTTTLGTTTSTAATTAAGPA